MANEINPTNRVTQASVQALDTNNDGRVDTVSVSTTQGGSSTTGIYNVQSQEGQAALMRDLQSLTRLPSADLNLSSSAQSYISSLDPNLGGELRTIASGLSTNLASGTAPTADLQGRWAEFMSQLATHGNADVNALVQFVLREAYMENTKDLQFYAQKVRFYNALKENIRDELTKARELLGLQAGREDGDALVYTYTGSDGTTTNYGTDNPDRVPFYEQNIPTEPALNQSTGAWETQAATKGDAVQTKEGLEKYIENLEEKLNSVGDDAQLANVDLQNMLQKQQQTMQMMSNIAKMLHDTAMAIIRKIGS